MAEHVARHRREEVIALLNALHLPMSESGKRRAAARAEWCSVMDQPLQVHDRGVAARFAVFTRESG
jgi:hypothetical protein